MKTDRELLELAAKAAGIPGEYVDYEIAPYLLNGPRVTGILEKRTMNFGIINSGPGAWNPLKNHEQLLQLKFKLCLDADEYLSDELYAFALIDDIQGYCRAIVRAAAAIGESMK